MQNIHCNVSDILHVLGNTENDFQMFIVQKWHDGHIQEIDKIKLHAFAQSSIGNWIALYLKEKVLNKIDILNVALKACTYYEDENKHRLDNAMKTKMTPQQIDDAVADIQKTS